MPNRLANDSAEHPRASFWAALGPFRNRALVVMGLVLVDTVMASLGIGMILPVFQALLDTEHKSSAMNALLPLLGNLDPVTRLTYLAAGTVLLFGAKAGISILTSTMIFDFLQRLRFHWIARIGENYLYGPYRHISSRKQGELLNDWFNESLAATRYYQAAIGYYSSGALVLGLITIGMFVNWRVMAAMLAIGALLSFVARRYLYGSSTVLSKRRVKLNQSVSSSMVEDLTHVRDLKLMQAERPRLARLEQLCEELKVAVMRGAVVAEVPRIAGEFIAVMAVMLFVVMGMGLLRQPPESMLPMLAFFFVAFYRLVGTGSAAMSSRIRALNEQHSVELVSRLSAPRGDQEDLDTGLALDRLESDVLLRDLHFSYDGTHSVLAGIAAVIPKGKTTFLLGPSGSGKSTLLDLLMRLEKPLSGYVEINSRNACDYSLCSWRRLFGYVSQEAALFNGSIKMNLRLANPDASETDIREACQFAGADAFIETLPAKYDTVVGDRGFSLSGGQRKRIAIARALIRKPAVLVLDEATTSFEQSLEMEMLAALKIAMPGLTIIQVTHRLSAAENAEWVIALDAGRVVAEGVWPDVKPIVAPLFMTSVESESHGEIYY